jgi:hypothetical protein
MLGDGVWVTYGGPTRRVGRTLHSAQRRSDNGNTRLLFGYGDRNSAYALHVYSIIKSHCRARPKVYNRNGNILFKTLTCTELNSITTESGGDM